MADKVQVSVEIPGTPEEVFDLAMDPVRTQDWVTIVKEVLEHDHGPLVKGYEMSQRLVLRGAPFTVKWKLVEVDRPRYARWEGKGPARSTAITENILEPHGDGTRFTYTNEFRTPFGPLGAVAGKAIMGGVPEREARASLEQLKALAARG